MFVSDRANAPGRPEGIMAVMQEAGVNFADFGRFAAALIRQLGSQKPPCRTEVSYVCFGWKADMRGLDPEPLKRLWKLLGGVIYLEDTPRRGGVSRLGCV